MEPLSCVLRVGERQSVGLHFGGRRRQRAACGGMAEPFIEATERSSSNVSILSNSNACRQLESSRAETKWFIVWCSLALFLFVFSFHIFLLAAMGFFFFFEFSIKINKFLSQITTLVPFLLLQHGSIHVVVVVDFLLVSFPPPPSQ